MARQSIIVAKDKKKRHTFILIEHKRGVAKCCVRCGAIRYYGKHRAFHCDNFDMGIMVYVPETDAHMAARAAL